MCFSKNKKGPAECTNQLIRNIGGLAGYSLTRNLGGLGPGPGAGVGAGAGCVSDFGIGVSWFALVFLRCSNNCNGGWPCTAPRAAIFITRQQ